MASNDAEATVIMRLPSIKKKAGKRKARYSFTIQEEPDDEDYEAENPVLKRLWNGDMKVMRYPIRINPALSPS